ncbi:Putative methyltransferase [Sulfidibacter corallicola]|uniref:tRNA (guanine(46)-N(7))-methyltransferase n=1 Tax=Sulfidibacter corallicola TaxID=2818388 RepID=A0A8A4TDA4_SULCO|nr:hypothetical protein [Sulfidibacter corallicola]QTD47643.1 hypothetical protein J3U87_18785 [Sulfidibacter corallicola]
MIEDRDFPIPEPDDNAVAAMEKAWRRADLQRYLVRWQTSPIPEVPTPFWDFSWRALDIGCGMGRYILREGERHPERAYLGVDKGNLRGGTMLDRVGAADRPNVFGLHTNIIPLLPKLPPNSLDQVSIFYPNPWWPTKHRQKRWSYHPILPVLPKLLRPGGRLLLTSNEAFYLGEFRYAVLHHPEITEMATSYAGPIRETEGRTHFEAKFITEGTPCGEVVFVRG